ncbi:MAG TPA: preprotein translocase subunit YajC, partial [Coprococcus sp.]|nr:preprotein translocase subunit YajC [Coprococcus sp.]
MNSLSTILSSSTGTQASGGSSVMFIVVYIAI